MIQPYSSRHNRSRTGQALLLAVLVMVFAALLGVTFITVVSINIGQTGREEERNKARQAAEAGLAFANLQLTNGIAGLRWRPLNEVTRYNAAPGVPVSGDPDYVAYWTPFENAQGWNSANFVKYPDPRSVNPTLNTPNYLLKLDRVSETDADNRNKDKTGAIRITSIGLSPDDPTSFYRIVAYKGGTAQQPGTRGAMEVTNWDFQNEIVPVAQVASSAGATSLEVVNLKGNWPPVPFYIMRGDPAHGGTVERHIVTSVAVNTLTLAATTPIVTAITAGERVEVAAALGAPLAIDYNADGTADTTTEQVEFQVSKEDIPGLYTKIPGSTYVNGGLIWQGNTFARNLLAPRLASTINAPASVKSTGLILTASGLTTVDGRIDDGSATVVSGTLQNSNSGTFPFTGAGTREQRMQLVEDGWNRLAGSPDPTRQVKPFTPPDITAGGQGFGRYRQLTKYSAVDTVLYPGASPQAAAYGYGQGVYINNPQDRERKGTGTAGRYADMTQADLMSMWYSSETASGNPALRLSEPAETIPTSAQSDTSTLEEMHLRGWVAPNEFLARGALIELDPVNALVHITLDSRNDGKANPHANGAATVYPYQGSTPNKGWRDVDGTLDGDATVGGVYRKSLPWPANGVIFAEGNIRVRGGAFDPTTGNTDLTVVPPRSLTIVSMNNIYIEGSLNAGARKVMLLAKKNVLMNPTAAIQKAEVQTRLSAAVSSTSTDISVHDANGFLPGDEIVIGASSERATVQAVLSPTSLRLTAAPTSGGNSEIVKLVDDPLRLGNRVYHQYATRITQFRDAVQRRIFLQGANTELRLAVRHSAERREALSVTTVQADTGHPSTPPPLQAATIANKLARSIQTTIIRPDHTTTNSSEKQFDTEYTDAVASGVARFPDPLHLSETAAMAFPVGNDAVAADGLMGALNDARSAPLWHYSASGLNGYHQLSGTAPHATRPPAHFLAAVGNRPEIIPDPLAPATYPYRRGIFIGDSEVSRRSYNIPMATSVVMNLNGLQQAFRSDHYNIDLSNFEFVKQFGFNFTFGIAAASDVMTWEDVLTADQTFYRNNTLTTVDNFAYDNVPYILDARTVKDLDTSSNNTLQGWNTLAFKFDPQTESYFDPAFPPTATSASMPYYRLSRLKIENANQLNASNEFETLEPGYTFDVRAYIYAQEGSWLVLSGGYYDEHIRTRPAGGDVFIDKPDPATGVYNGTFDAGEEADLNRDGGPLSRAEEVAAYRYRRYNYQVNITGAIMQKTTPVIDDPDGTGPMVGYVSDWMDKWATVTTSDANFGGPTGQFSKNLTYADGNFATISYTFDPSAALGVVDSDIIDEDRNNNGLLDPGEDLNSNGRLDKPGFVPAVSSELIYQTG